jgi:hypothetical protein
MENLLFYSMGGGDGRQGSCKAAQGPGRRRSSSATVAQEVMAVVCTCEI